MLYLDLRNGLNVEWEDVITVVTKSPFVTLTQLETYHLLLPVLRQKLL